ncbi:hypothetical protein [Sporolactobacillus pectinivorans]|uniref:hypothetical protein n=1 Tax=Sporolactobacillus pectinivorans TaxID=1591408 RepID=UPI0012FD16CE|nr:hypothetical protein [Sporolactobacillus pectinivorans]
MFQTYMGNEQFNFQINRFMEPYYCNRYGRQSIREAATKIHDTESRFSSLGAIC